MIHLKNNLNRQKLIFGITTITIFYIFYVTLIQFNQGVPVSTQIDKDTDEGNVSCDFPKLDAFDASVRDFIRDEIFKCTASGVEMFDTDLNSNLVQIINPTDEGWADCCYKNVQEGEEVERDGTFLDCIPIVSNFTEISTSYYAISIYCTKISIEDSYELKSPSKTLVDIFPLFHPKKEELKVVRHQKLSVVLLGLDSMSHMNLIRMMPATFEFLIHNLSAIGMNGYTKVGDNTFPNLVPALSGLTPDELVPLCWPAQRTTFDLCPFIWKNYADQGYYTSLLEDLYGIEIFQYAKGGFKIPPTHDYIGPLMHQSEHLLGSETEASEFPICFGPRFAFRILLDHMKKVAGNLNLGPYFQLVWATSGFHGVLHFGRAVDTLLRSFLEWCLAEGHLNSTVFVFMSDHGARFGQWRETEQGRIEERMPFLYFVLPKWFRDQNPRAVGNMVKNQDRLSSPFDLYETLVDLLHPENLEVGRPEVDRPEVGRPEVGRLEVETSNRKGTSLFRLLPKNRTCRDAGIVDEWCVCGEFSRRGLKYPVDEAFVETGANALVEHVNELLINYPECAQLGIDTLLRAESFSDKGVEKLRLTLRVFPGGGVFEAELSRPVDSYHWIVGKQISRINLYGNQSQCINSPSLKKFCYCS